MKITILLVLSACSLFAQAQHINQVATGDNSANIVAAGNVTMPAKADNAKDLFVVYESYGLKGELAQRRSKDGVAAATARFQAQADQNVQQVLSGLQKEQEATRLRICAAEKLAPTCVVTQNQQTGEWSAGPGEPAQPVVPGPTPPVTGATGPKGPEAAAAPAKKK